jgi:hypothetical protein
VPSAQNSKGDKKKKKKSGRSEVDANKACVYYNGKRYEPSDPTPVRVEKDGCKVADVPRSMYCRIFACANIAVGKEDRATLLRDSALMSTSKYFERHVPSGREPSKMKEGRKGLF